MTIPPEDRTGRGPHRGAGDGDPEDGPDIPPPHGDPLGPLVPGEEPGTDPLGGASASPEGRGAATHGGPDYTDEEAARLEETLERAHRYGEEGDWQAMADHLAEALETFERDPFVLCWLGVAERELGLDTVAYERFKRCLATQPTDPHVLATAGNAVAAFDDPDAEAALRAASVLAPHLPLARWMYGAYLSREGYTDRALDELRVARELDPDDPVIAFELGVAHALAGERDPAIDALHEAGGLDPEDGWTRVVLGLLLLEDERLDDAAAELSAGARLRPEDVEAQLLASLAASAAGLDDLAWEMLERGRQRAEGGDRDVAEAVDDRIARGPEHALRFLRQRLAPTALRERLMTRP